MRRTTTVIFAILLTATLSCVSSGQLDAAAPERPNIIVIMADDLGYGDVSCNGATALQTPNIDKLASEGIRFTDGYCSASTCTPTRYSFLTGDYAFRTKGTGVAPPNASAIIQPGTHTVASILAAGGYGTGVVGKWHLGLGGKSGPDWNGELNPGPLEIGFDSCFLLPTTNDRVPQVYVQDHRVLNLDPADPLWVGDEKPSEDYPTGISERDSLRMDWSHGHNGTIHNGISRIGFYTGGHAARFRDEDMADKWIEKSNEFIEQHRDKPFFLFFAGHDIHVPRMPHERFQGKTSLGYRGDCVIEFDWCVGELMKTLDRLGLAENTLVILTSDNGPVLDDGYKDGAIEKIGSHRAAGKFTGGKYSIYEGGTRVPFITRWPGHIQPGVSSEVVCTVDLAASLAAIAGQSVPEGACRDSIDISGALLGLNGSHGREWLVQQDNGNRGNFGFRKGKWKLIRHDSGRAHNVVVEEPLQMRKVPEFMLFNLDQDPAEQHNVIEEHPEIATQMKDELAAIVERKNS